MMDATSPELWRPIPGWRGCYEASTWGAIRSVDRWVPHGRGNGQRRVSGKLLTPTADDHRHLYVNLWSESKQTRRYVHVLVLTTFAGPCPAGMEGCHKNGDPAVNYVWNLRWDTHSANMLDSVYHGTHHWSSKEMCPRDHLLVHPNLIPSALPKRGCLACNRAQGCERKAIRAGRPFDFRSVANAKYLEIMGRRSA